MADSSGNSSDAHLAINGGPAAVDAPDFAWPLRDEAVRNALEAVYADGDWGRYEGARCAALRGELALLTASEHVHLCCSGTVAVELALRSVGVGPGDEVLIAAYDFPGNFRAVEAVGAAPVLADVCQHGWTLDLSAVEAAAADGELTNVRAVVASHLHGDLVDMQRLMKLAADQRWQVVEDACQTPGAVVERRPAGSWGHVGVLSFGGSKLLTAGRGGAIVTTDDAIAQRARVAANRGNDAFPLSELQAAVLLPQLSLLEERNGRRGANAALLRERVAGLDGAEPGPAAKPWDAPAYYKFAWRARPERLRSSREWLIAALRAEGAPVDAGFRGFARRSARRCRRATTVTHAESAAEQTLLLHHPALLAPTGVVEQVGAAIEKVFLAATADNNDGRASLS